MSILLTRSSSEFNESDTSNLLVTAAPCSVVMWIYMVTDPSTINAICGGLMASDETANVFRIRSASAGSALQVRREESGTSESKNAGTVVINTWHHVGFSFSTSTSGFPWLDAVVGAELTTDLTPAGINQFSLGNLRGSTSTDYWNGRIAEVGIYDIALTQGHFTDLFTNKKSPELVAAGNLKHYFRFSTFDDDADRAGSLTWESNNGATADHPPGIEYAVAGGSPVLYPAAQAGDVMPGPPIGVGY